MFLVVVGGISVALSGGPTATCAPRFRPISASATASVTAPALKATLLSAIGSESLSATPPADLQMEVNEILLQLCSASPTAEPARSPLLNGRWEVIYAGSPGAGLADSPTRLLALALYAMPLSPSVLAQGLAKLPFNAASLGALFLTITSPEAGQPRVTIDSTLSVFGGASQPVVLRAQLQPRSAVALREDFVEAEVLGQRSLLPGPFALSRSLYVAYLDEDVMIVRDETGLPNVLKRTDKYEEAAVPSYVDDDAAPGAG